MPERAVYLNLLKFSFPITAVVSILHRVSGVILFLTIPIFFSMLQDAFFFAPEPVEPRTAKILIWFSLSTLGCHLFAGIRHLMMDMGFGESYKISRITAYTVLVLTGLFSILIGWKLW